MKRILFTLLVTGLILSHVGVSYSEDEKELKDLQGWLSKLGKNYSIKELKNLTKLSLHYENIGKLPEFIGQLKNLRELDLSYNGLNSLPESISQLKNLNELDLSYNNLKRFPESIGQLINLKILDLRNNQLEILSESIGQLKNLEQLHLSNNQLKTLPESIGQLKNLRILDLSNNQLKSLPKSIEKLKNLRELNLLYNQLRSLPESIVQLKRLRLLNLESYLPFLTQIRRKRAIGREKASRKWGKSSGILKKNMIAPSYRFLSLPNQSDRHYFGVSYEFRLFKNLNPNKSDTFGYLFGSISFSTDRYMRVPLFGALTYPIAFIPLIVISFQRDQTMDDAILRHLAYLMAEGLGLRIYTASWLYISPFMGLSLDIPLKEDDYLMGLEAGLRFDFLPSKDFSISPYSSAYFELLKGDVGFSAGLNVGFYF